MVTLCLAVYRYQERHYVFREPDGYPEQAGDLFIKKIPAGESLGYQQWLKRKRLYYSGLEAQISNNFREVVPEYRVEPGLGLYSYQNRVRALRMDDEKNYLITLDQLPTMALPLDGYRLRWIYCIDLDREIFTVCNYYHFPLASIPKDWKTTVQRMRPHEFTNLAAPPRFFPGSNEPEVGLVAIAGPTAPLLISRDCCGLQLKNVFVVAKSLAAFAIGKRVAVHFACLLFRRMIAVSKTAHWEYLALCSIRSVAVRETIYAVLCLASGSPDYLSFVPARPVSSGFTRNEDDIHFGLVGEKDGEPEVVSSLTYGFHGKGKKPYLTTDDDIFWFEGVIVCLWDNLEEECNAQAAIKYLIETARSQSRSNFHAIIISSKYVIVIQVMPGEIHRTTPLRFLDVNEATDAQTSLTDADNSCSNGGYAAFIAIAHLLEAAKIQSLREHPEFPLPIEVISTVLAFTDKNSRAKLAALSRRLRYECQRVCWFTGNSFLFNQGGTPVLRICGKDTSYHIQDPPKQVQDIATSPYATWVPIVGHKSRTRSLLVDAAFQFAIDRSFELNSTAYLEACN